MQNMQKNGDTMSYTSLLTYLLHWLIGLDVFQTIILHYIKI